MSKPVNIIMDIILLKTMAYLSHIFASLQDAIADGLKRLDILQQRETPRAIGNGAAVYHSPHF